MILRWVPSTELCYWIMLSFCNVNRWRVMIRLFYPNSYRVIPTAIWQWIGISSRVTSMTALLLKCCFDFWNMENEVSHDTLGVRWWDVTEWFQWWPYWISAFIIMLIESTQTLLPAGCHGNLTVLNLLCASVAKNQHFRTCRKNYALDRKMIATF